MKATEQYFPVVLFIMLYKVVLTFESVDEILKCDHSNESHWAVLYGGIGYYAVQRWKLTDQFFPAVLFIVHHLIHLKINKIFFFLCHIYFIFRSAITHLQYAVIGKSKLNQQKWWN